MHLSCTICIHIHTPDRRVVRLPLPTETESCLTPAPNSVLGLRWHGRGLHLWLTSVPCLQKPPRIRSLANSYSLSHSLSLYLGAFVIGPRLWLSVPACRLRLKRCGSCTSAVRLRFGTNGNSLSGRLEILKDHERPASEGDEWR